MQRWASKRLVKSAITASRRRTSSLSAPHFHLPPPSGHLDHPLPFSHSDSAAAAAAASVSAHRCSCTAAAAASPAPAAARIAGSFGEVQRRRWTWAGARHHTGTSVPLEKTKSPTSEVAARSEHKGGDPGVARRGEANHVDGIEAQPLGLGSCENAGRGTGEEEDCGLLVDIYEAREVVLASRRRRKAELSHAGQQQQQQQQQPVSLVVGEAADVRMRQLTLKVGDSRSDPHTVPSPAYIVRGWCFALSQSPSISLSHTHHNPISPNLQNTHIVNPRSDQVVLHASYTKNPGPLP